jgi:hypothetical protein
MARRHGVAVLVEAAGGWMAVLLALEMAQALGQGVAVAGPHRVAVLVEAGGVAELLTLEMRH